jgi:hypothetical protein
VATLGKVVCLSIANRGCLPMDNNEVTEMYERNQELIEEMWEDLYEDDIKVDRLILNHGDINSFPFQI